MSGKRFVMNEVVKIALLGYGTVGSGVVHILKAHSRKLEQVIGKRIEISKILVRDTSKYTVSPEDTFILTTDFNAILADKDIAMIVEVMGSIDVAKAYITQALMAKKHVVTANKDLIALHGSELMQLAKGNQCDLYYEASVGGGIPILRTLVNSMASDRIQEVSGIVNGTTNYMLTQMTQEQLSYEQALKQAQDKGFAEADPTNDVEGIDAARKMVILTRLAFGMNVELSDVQVEGISSLDKIDMANADQLGCTVKLLGLAKLVDEKIYVEVGPTLVSKQHPLSSVSHENNAVVVTGAAVGETMFYGKGAGELPTANSVVSDIIHVAKNMMLQTTGNVFSSYNQQKQLLAPSDIYFSYYYRLEVLDQPGMFSELIQIFSKQHVNVNKIKQEQLNDNRASVMIMTHPISVATHRCVVNALKKQADITLNAALRVMA